MKEMKAKEKKIEYNIEYAHIYANSSFNKEQKRSINKLQKVIEILNHLKAKYVLTVLIDEYNFPKHPLTIKKILKELVNFRAKPDFIGFIQKIGECKTKINN